MANVATLPNQPKQDDIENRTEAVEVMFSMLLKQLTAQDPTAMRKYANNLRRAAEMSHRVVYHGRSLSPATWQHIQRVTDDLDTYVSKFEQSD